ncbi:hypothetical protein MHBO_001077 [Bonamia ostreae]|uniref:Uncharacterized protein n=1 Tax=Bonamia ostreae TaxID=126728 RepID=A0ABV2AHR4_9EUKA
MLNQKANSKDDRYSLSLNIPFERPKIIGYNANYWGIFINWLCTLSRMMMIIYLTLRITDLALFIVLSFLIKS